MKHRLSWSSLLLLTLCLALAPTAMASNTWYVDGVNGSDTNDCKSLANACATIGHAISLASSGDSVIVAATTYMENLTINISLQLTGSGAPTTIIDGGGAGSVISILNTSAVVALSEVTIQNGIASGGAGILNWGTLTLNNTTLSGNMALSETSAAGGGIFSSGTLTITNSTLNGNSGSSRYVFGGAIYNSGTLTITNSTLSQNASNGTVGGGGGGIYSGSGNVTINSSTFSANSATGDGGGGIYNGGGTLTIQNSIVANSKSGGDCLGSMTSNGYNLSSDQTCNFNNFGDANNTDPKLGPLQSNGGPTQTQALLDGSPAIDAGNPAGCTDGQSHLLTTDQRGEPRPDKEESSGCDMGAYERQTTGPYPLTVSLSGTGSGTVTSNPSGINCPGTCTSNFNSGTSVTLTPIAGNGSTFAGWSGACSGTGTCTVIMNTAQAVTATFNTTQTFLLTVTKGGTGTGSVTSNPSGINCGSVCGASFASGTVVTLAATPDPGSTFTGWRGACSGKGSCTVTMNAANLVKATFAVAYPLTVTKAGAGTGTVKSSPSGIKCGATCSHNFKAGTMVTLTEKPDAGHTFGGWSGACSGLGVCKVTMTGAETVVATFN